MSAVLDVGSSSTYIAYNGHEIHLYEVASAKEIATWERRALGAALHVACGVMLGFGVFELLVQIGKTLSILPESIAIEHRPGASMLARVAARRACPNRPRTLGKLANPTHVAILSTTSKRDRLVASGRQALRSRRLRTGEIGAFHRCAR